MICTERRSQIRTDGWSSLTAIPLGHVCYHSVSPSTRDSAIQCLCIAEKNACALPMSGHPVPSSSPPMCGAVIDAQNKLSGSVLEKCPGRPELEQVITKLMDYPRNHIPFKRGGMLFVPSHKSSPYTTQILTHPLGQCPAQSWP